MSMWKPVDNPLLSQEKVMRLLGRFLDGQAMEHCDQTFRTEPEDLGWNLDRAAEARWLTPPHVVSRLDGEGWAMWQAFLVRTMIHGQESEEVRDTEEAISEYLIVMSTTEEMEV